MGMENRFDQKCFGSIKINDVIILFHRVVDGFFLAAKFWLKIFMNEASGAD